MPCKENRIYKKAIDYIDKQMDRIKNTKPPDANDIKIVLAAISLKREDVEDERKEVLKEILEKFKKNENKYKKPKSAKKNEYTKSKSKQEKGP